MSPGISERTEHHNMSGGDFCLYLFWHLAFDILAAFDPIVTNLNWKSRSTIWAPSFWDDQCRQNTKKKSSPLFQNSCQQQRSEEASQSLICWALQVDRAKLVRLKKNWDVRGHLFYFGDAFWLFLGPDVPPLVQVGDDLGGQPDVVSDNLLVDGEAAHGPDPARQIAVHDRAELALAEKESGIGKFSRTGHP